MGRVHRFLGLDRRRASSPTHDARPSAARQYAATSPTAPTTSSASTTCATTWRGSTDELVQRGHNFAIVDEVDSILIDEARTPLIISGPADQPTEVVRRVRRASSTRLQPRRRDYEVDEKKRTVGVLERGIEKVEDYLGIDNLYESVNTPLVGYLNNAIKAKELFKRDKDYVVMNGEVLIVDEHTGRILAGRRYNEGMHQAIEAKEGVEIKQREPDPRHDHPAELLPPLRQARRHDRYGHDRGRRVQPDLQARRRADPDQPPDGPRSTRPTSSTRPRRPSSTPSSTTSSSATRRASRSSSAPSSVEKSELPVRAAAQARHPARGPQRQAARARGARSSRRPAARAPSPSPPTWPAAAPTSCSAATPSSWPSPSCAQRGLDPVETPEEYEAAWPEALEKAHEVGRGRARRGRRARRPLRARHRAARVAPHRQPAARSLRPSGRPGRVPVLPLARGRPDAAVQRRRWSSAVMTGSNIPDDVPIESKMVTRAIRVGADARSRRRTSRSARTSSSTTRCSTASARSSTTSAAGCSRARTCTSRSAT